MLTTEDFGVVLKNLPEPEDYGTIEELKAAMWLHLEKVLSSEKQ